MAKTGFLMTYLNYFSDTDTVDPYNSALRPPSTPSKPLTSRPDALNSSKKTFRPPRKQAAAYVLNRNKTVNLLEKIAPRTSENTSLNKKARRGQKKEANGNTENKKKTDAQIHQKQANTSPRKYMTEPSHDKTNKMAYVWNATTGTLCWIWINILPLIICTVLISLYEAYLTLCAIV